MPEPVALFWSGGKDAALACHALLHDPSYRVDALITTLSACGEWVPMHGIHRAVIAAQAESLGVRWVPVPLPEQPSNAAYEAALERAFASHLPDTPTTIAAGDVFLSDVRDYRAGLIEACGYEALFPLWGCDVSTWSRRWADARGMAYVNSVDPGQLAPAFIGRHYNAALVASLPEAVDPAGEQGAFHTVVTDLDAFAAALHITLGPHDASGPTTYAPARLAPYT